MRVSNERAEQAFGWHLRGETNRQISARLGISEQAVSKSIRRLAAAHPLTTMTPEQRAGVASAMMQAVGREIWAEIEGARARGENESVRSLLSTASLHAHRVSRILLAQPDSVVNITTIAESTVNSLSPMGADTYQAWLQSGGPGQLTALPPQAPSSDRVIVEETDTQASM